MGQEERFRHDPESGDLMGGYKRHDPTVYIMRWPDQVLKVGYSANQRWRKHIFNGGEVLALFVYPTSTEAFAFETAGHEFLRASAGNAFAGRGDAIDHLGPDCDGWAECFRGSEACAQALLAYMHEQCPTYRAEQYQWEV